MPHKIKTSSRANCIQFLMKLAEHKSKTTVCCITEEHMKRKSSAYIISDRIAKFP